jgi:hypothetical protein
MFIAPAVKLRWRIVLLAALLSAAVGGGTAGPSVAQELDCRVTVNYENLEGSYSFLEELEPKVEDYFNNETWTDDRFQDSERINCNVQILFQEATSLTDFQAQLVVSGRRPIYATTQQTTVVNLRDKSWQFSYTKGAPLVHDTERYDALTTVLDFYAYVLLGYDYDTFSEQGGTPHFEEARRLAQIAQSVGAPGWSPVGGRGRITLVTQLLDARYEPLRDAVFRYHFGALDRFIGDTAAARQAALEALQSLQTFNETVSRRYVLDLFFSTKYQELAALFEGSPLESRAHALLSQLDASHLSTYESLK